MKQVIENQDMISSCIRCGYCCKVGPCSYGETIEEHCRFLMVDDSELGTYKCLIYKEIKEFEKDETWPMFDCGCSSPLFNTVRNEVIRRTKQKNGI